MSSELAEIVESASASDGQELMQNVLQHELPPELDALVDEYVTLEGARDRFMWQWVHELAPQNTLPIVEAAHLDKVPTDKTLTILFVTLLDDVLEKRRDRVTFEEASKLPFPSRSVNWDRRGLDVPYVEFAQKVWEVLDRRLAAAPEYSEYVRLFRYDLRQAINAIEYTHLVIERPDLATMHDLELYESHNMVMYAYLDIDLMHADRAYKDDLAVLRRAMWPAQQMARIGNWLSTWERELREGDYSSGILVYALSHDVITKADLDAIEAGDEAAFEAAVTRIEDHGVEELFLARWDDFQAELRSINRHEIHSIDLTPYVEGLKVVMRYHLASRGLK